LDEKDLNNTEARNQIAAVHEAGAKVFCAEHTQYAYAIADVLDLVIMSQVNKTVADLYHQYNHSIYSYNNPQGGVELPLTYRRNFGLTLWQNNYDGAADYAYQHSFNNSWNDFDDVTYRDHNFVYPTVSGIVDTIEFAGFREAANDVRYLTLLNYTIN